jgi:hypothetical protein
MDEAAIMAEALRTFMRIQAAKRLAALGQSAPEMMDIPRRNRESDDDN